ncbi:MAG: Rid family detoxifying hydrolase [Chloroflexota bacterium]|nr:Rid family detoxifying hydrolase [Chloroflexota bacterium]
MALREVSTGGAPRPGGPYSQGIDSGGFVFVAGQIGTDPVTGQLADGVSAQAERALRNIVAVLDAAALTIGDVVKMTVLLADIADFDTVNGVYARFVADPPPARTTFAVAALPRGARVEIEAIAARPGPG